MVALKNQKKSELIREIEMLQAQIKQQRNAMAPFRYAYGTLIPCGPVIDLSNHPLADEIREIACSQYDGHTGWIPYQINPCHLPYEYVIAHVSYTEQDGTWVDQFIPATFLDRKLDATK